MLLTEAIAAVEPIDRAYENACWEYWDSLCKPLRGLGRLEELTAQIGAIERTDRPHINKRAIVIMGADNGVVEEGVSQTDSEVTAQVLENMGNDITTVCMMSHLINARVIPVNIGMNRDARHEKVRNVSIRKGTGNIAKGPAMTREECIAAIELGINTVIGLKEEGYDLIVTGEMGIGNTTTSSACACVLFGRDPEEMTGRGAGLTSEGLVKKIGAVKSAIAVNAPDPTDAIDICSKVGGLDIAGMTGCFIGAAVCHIPVLIDGVISGIAACFAHMLCPAAKEYMIATHRTAEPAGAMIEKRLGVESIIHAGMHLGEGTGAAVFVSFLDHAINVYENLPDFNGGNVKKYEHLK